MNKTSACILGVCFAMCGTSAFPADPADIAANTMKPAAAAEDDSAYDLGSVLIEGHLASKYREEEVTSLYFPVAPEKLPVVVDVLTSDYIREQDADDIHDLLFNYPGIFGGGKSLNDRTSGEYTIRGRSGSSPTIDGVVPLVKGMGLFTDPNVFERVEIAKGPVGALEGGKTCTRGPYGVGGSINLVQKKPDPTRNFTNFEISTAFGDHKNRFRFAGDTNFRIFDRVYVRIPAGMDFGREFWLPHSNDMRQSYTFAPSFLFEASEDLRFVVNTLFQYLDTPGYQGIPAWRGKPLSPYDWDSYVPWHNDVRDKYSAFSVTGYAEWDASDIWQFRAGGAFSASDVEYEHISSETYAPTRETLTAGPVAVTQSRTQIAPRVKALNHNLSDRHDKAVSLYGRAIAKYEFMGAENTSLIHGDMQRTDTFSYSVSRSEKIGPEKYKPLSVKGTRPSSSKLDRMGLALQHFMEFGMLNVLGGIRTDRHESNLGNHGNSLSPRLGVSIIPLNGVVLFGNFSRTESPNFGYMKNENEELTSSWNTEQWECGARFSPLENLWLTLSYYWIEVENTPSYVEETGYYVIEGMSKNEGVELSLAGDITKNWSVYAGYAHDKSKTTNDSQRKVQSMPPHTATLQTSYRVPGGLLKDLKLGFGLRYKHGYDAPFRGRYVGPDYYFNDVTVCDISAEIPFSMFGGNKDWSVRFGIDNLFDKNYFASNRHYYECFVGDPRTFKISLKGKF